MLPITPETAQWALNSWASRNRGNISLDEPTKVTPREFEEIYVLLRATDSLGVSGGLPFAIVSVEIEESKPELKTGAARVRLSIPRLLSEQELGLDTDNQG